MRVRVHAIATRTRARVPNSPTHYLLAIAKYYNQKDAMTCQTDTYKTKIVSLFDVLI